MPEINLEKTEISTPKVVLIVIAAISSVVSFYTWVIIPLNNIQVQLAQIQTSLSDFKQFQQDTITHLNALDKQVTTINQKFNIPQ